MTEYSFISTISTKELRALRGQYLADILMHRNNITAIEAELKRRVQEVSITKDQE